MIEKFSQAQLGKECEKRKRCETKYLEAKKKAENVVYQANCKTVK